MIRRRLDYALIILMAITAISSFDATGFFAFLAGIMTATIIGRLWKGRYYTIGIDPDEITNLTAFCNRCGLDLIDDQGTTPTRATLLKTIRFAHAHTRRHHAN